MSSANVRFLLLIVIAGLLGLALSSLPHHTAQASGSGEAVNVPAGVLDSSAE